MERIGEIMLRKAREAEQNQGARQQQIIDKVDAAVGAMGEDELTQALMICLEGVERAKPGGEDAPPNVTHAVMLYLLRVQRLERVIQALLSQPQQELLRDMLADMLADAFGDVE